MDDRMRDLQKARAVDGRRLKTKGANTRQRILDVLEELLETTPLAELKMARVAETAGIGMSTAYSYFECLDDALLALVSQPKFSYAKPLELLRRPWAQDQAMAQAKAFAGACLDFWDRHRAVLRLRNLKSDEGDMRFLNVRLSFTMPVLDALSEKITLVKAAGRLPAHLPSSAFAALALAAIERNGAAYSHINRHDRSELIEAMACMLVDWLVVPARAGTAA
jgi:AcrR family transcriptional regulator